MKKFFSPRHKAFFGRFPVVFRSFSAVLAVLSAFALAGCKTIHETAEVPVEAVKTLHDTLRQNIVQHDSVYLQDSVLVTDSMTERWHTVYRYRLRHDTVYMSRIDTIEKPVYVTKTKTVERKQHWWEGLLQGVGLTALIACAAAMIFRKKS